MAYFWMVWTNRDLIRTSMPGKNHLSRWIPFLFVKLLLFKLLCINTYREETNMFFCYMIPHRSTWDQHLISQRQIDKIHLFLFICQRQKKNKKQENAETKTLWLKCKNFNFCNGTKRFQLTFNLWSEFYVIFRLN